MFLGFKCRISSNRKLEQPRSNVRILLIEKHPEQAISKFRCISPCVFRTFLVFIDVFFTVFCPGSNEGKMLFFLIVSDSFFSFFTKRSSRNFTYCFLPSSMVLIIRLGSFSFTDYPIVK